jgi:hypothetical protein
MLYDTLETIILGELGMLEYYIFSAFFDFQDTVYIINSND